MLSQLTAAERMAIAGQTGVELTPAGSVADRPGPPQPPLQLILRMAEQRLAQRREAATAEHPGPAPGVPAARGTASAPPAGAPAPPTGLSAAPGQPASPAGPAPHVDLNL
ncbi:MAG TPA: hypothetical protein VNV66_18400 [Pilimelia sp.]|nr:hypothetical protein [Pilimelia sp.]